MSANGSSTPDRGPNVPVVNIRKIRHAVFNITSKCDRRHHDTAHDSTIGIPDGDPEQQNDPNDRPASQGAQEERVQESKRQPVQKDNPGDMIEENAVAASNLPRVVAGAGESDVDAPAAPVLRRHR
jgi:hypothetical protein